MSGYFKGFCIILAILLVGCRFSTDKTNGLSADALYQQANQAMQAKEYRVAIKRYENLDSTYPFNSHAETALKELIYCYYQHDDLPETIATADRFIRLYPSSAHLDYIYYLKALANFAQTRGIYAKFLPLDASWRDPGTQGQAYQDFTMLVTRFPKSRYAADANLRLIFLRNQFARHELQVAEFYFKRNLLVAAANRASYLIEHYPQAPEVKPALILLVKANQTLGATKAAHDALAVLRKTYPNESFSLIK